MADDRPADVAGDTIGRSEPAEASPPVTPSTDPGRDVTPDFRGTGLSAALVIGLLLAVLTIVVAIQNTGNANVEFLAWNVDAPLVAVILAATVAGVVLDEALGFFWRRRRRRNLAERAELWRLRHR